MPAPPWAFLNMLKMLHCFLFHRPAPFFLFRSKLAEKFHKAQFHVERPGRAIAGFKEAEPPGKFIDIPGYKGVCRSADFRRFGIAEGVAIERAKRLNRLRSAAEFRGPGIGFDGGNVSPIGGLA